jgi:hypothetical protein
MHQLHQCSHQDVKLEPLTPVTYISFRTALATRFEASLHLRQMVGIGRASASVSYLCLLTTPRPLVSRTHLSHHCQDPYAQLGERKCIFAFFWLIVLTRNTCTDGRRMISDSCCCQGISITADFPSPDFHIHQPLHDHNVTTSQERTAR